MKYRVDNAEDLAVARAAVREWRVEHPEGTPVQLVGQVGAVFGPDWAPVLRAMLFVVDRRAARVVSGVVAAQTRAAR